jgi:hypothetical protein
MPELMTHMAFPGDVTRPLRLRSSWTEVEPKLTPYPNGRYLVSVTVFVPGVGADELPSRPARRDWSRG